MCRSTWSDGFLRLCAKSCRLQRRALRNNKTLNNKTKKFGSIVMNSNLAGFAGASVLLLLAAPSFAQATEPLSIVVFGPPSLGAFLPPVIKAQKFDEKNGLAIKFEERTPDAYTAQFNSGEFQLGGSASLLTVGLADTRGVKVTYLFNLFDFWGAVVTSRPEVKTLKDL